MGPCPTQPVQASDGAGLCPCLPWPTSHESKLEPLICHWVCVHTTS